MPTPAAIATSAQYRPRIPDAVLPEPSQVSPPHTQINSARLRNVYVVQESDQLGELAQRLYGANVPQSRAKILNQGFYPGSVIQH